MLKVALIMGSPNDLSKVMRAVEQLRELEIPTETRVLSAHRSPEKTVAFAKNAAENGFGVIIAAAGLAAHLAGAIAANTILPVIGLPIEVGGLGGMDALLSTAQMPSGVPVATVGINAAKNAALLAAQILALNEPELQERLLAMRAKGLNELEKKDSEIASLCKLGKEE